MTAATRPPHLSSDLGYLDPHQTAQLLGVHVGTLSNWRGAGLGPPFYRLHARAVVYLRAEVEAWIASRRVSPDQVPTLTNPMKGRTRLSRV